MFNFYFKSRLIINLVVHFTLFWHCNTNEQRRVASLDEIYINLLVRQFRVYTLLMISDNSQKLCSNLVDKKDTSGHLMSETVDMSAP